MRVSRLRGLLFTIPLVGVFGQTPALQMNVVYVCTDGQSFKVFSCTGVGDTAGCDFQNYKNGQAFQRGQALRKQLSDLIPAKCHAQTTAEAQTDPHRGEIPAPSAQRQRQRLLRVLRARPPPRQLRKSPSEAAMDRGSADSKSVILCRSTPRSVG